MYFKSPIQTGAFCETEEQFPGEMSVRFYFIGLSKVWCGLGGCTLGTCLTVLQTAWHCGRLWRTTLYLFPQG